MNTNKTLLSFAFLVRSQVCEWIKDNDDCDPEDMTGSCAITSYTLYRVLRHVGYDAQIRSATTCVEGHCWVELDNNVIDLTATQYDESLEKIYIVDKKFYIENEIKRFFKHQNDLKIYNNASTIKYIKTWHNQSPQLYISNINNLLKNIKNLRINTN